MKVPVWSPPLSRRYDRGMESLDELRARALVCQACPLAERRTNVVFGEGDSTSPLVLVGEGPGEQEDKTGRPFVGRAGQLLDKALEEVGMGRQGVYICNTVKCRAADWSTGKPANRARTCSNFFQPCSFCSCSPLPRIEGRWRWIGTRFKRCGLSYPPKFRFLSRGLWSKRVRRCRQIAPIRPTEPIWRADALRPLPNLPKVPRKALALATVPRSSDPLLRPLRQPAP